jgi:hypothetical protein
VTQRRSHRTESLPGSPCHRQGRSPPAESRTGTQKKRATILVSRGRSFCYTFLDAKRRRSGATRTVFSSSTDEQDESSARAVVVALAVVQVSLRSRSRSRSISHGASGQGSKLARPIRSAHRGGRGEGTQPHEAARPPPSTSVSTTTAKSRSATGSRSDAARSSARWPTRRREPRDGPRLATEGNPPRVSRARKQGRASRAPGQNL